MIRNAAVFILISCFYGAYFAKQLLLRRKGICANRLAKGDKPRRTRAIERGLLALTYAAAVIQYAGVFMSDYMLPLSLPDAARWVGLAVTACGVMFFIMAVAAMRDNWRAGVDAGQKTAIVTAGIYRFSRNPAFVGFDMLYIGAALATPNAFICAAAIMGVVLLHLQIVEEERHLSAAFGDEYARYKRKTPRYLLFG